MHHNIVNNARVIAQAMHFTERDSLGVPVPLYHCFDLRSLRTGMMAGAPCPIETMKRVVSQMNMSEVTIGYGMTETLPVSFQSAISDPLERRVSTVGRIQPHIEAKVIDGSGDVVPARSRSSCSATRECSRCRCSACPTRSTARRSARGSC